jgi:hypothetical protein
MKIKTHQILVCFNQNNIKRDQTQTSATQQGLRIFKGFFPERVMDPPAKLLNADSFLL